MKLPLVDLVFLALLGLLALRGFLRGFTGEFFSFAAAALGLMAALLLFRNGAAFVRERYPLVFPLPELLSFAVIFLVIFIAGKMLERVVADIVKRLGLTALDRCLGLVFGLAKAAALIILILFLLAVQPLFNPSPLLEQSFFARLLLPLLGQVERYVPPPVPGGVFV